MPLFRYPVLFAWCILTRLSDPGKSMDLIRGQNLPHISAMIRVSRTSNRKSSGHTGAHGAPVSTTGRNKGLQQTPWIPAQQSQLRNLHFGYLVLMKWSARQAVPPVLPVYWYCLPLDLAWRYLNFAGPSKFRWLRGPAVPEACMQLSQKHREMFWLKCKFVELQSLLVM